MLEQGKLDGWRRLGAAILREAAADDPEAFAQVVAIVDEWRADLTVACAQLRAGRQLEGRPSQSGYSWEQIGRALGVSRQAAFQRFGVRRGYRLPR